MNIDCTLRICDHNGDAFEHALPKRDPATGLTVRNEAGEQLVGAYVPLTLGIVIYQALSIDLPADRTADLEERFRRDDLARQFIGTPDVVEVTPQNAALIKERIRFVHVTQVIRQAYALIDAATC